VHGRPDTPHHIHRTHPAQDVASQYRKAGAGKEEKQKENKHSPLSSPLVVSVTIPLQLSKFPNPGVKTLYFSQNFDFFHPVTFEPTEVF